MDPESEQPGTGRTATRQVDEPGDGDQPQLEEEGLNPIPNTDATPNVN
jgi:hypothetical protein